MLNLIRADFYKLFHIKSFYVCTIVLLAFVAIIAASFKTIDNMPEDQKQEIMTVSEDSQTIEDSENGIKVEVSDSLLKSGINFAFVGVVLIGLVNLLIGIMVALGIGGEFKERTIKSMVAKGYKRELVVLSKMIVYIAATFFMLVITMVFSFILGWALSGNVGSMSSSDISNYIQMTLGIFGIYFAYSVLFTLVVFIIRNVELSVVINVLLVVFGPMVLDKLESLLKIKFSEVRLDIAFSRLTGDDGLTAANLQHVALLVLIYVIVSVVGSCVLFKRADVK